MDDPTTRHAPPDPAAAAAVLADLRERRAELAERARSPRGYHLALGLLRGALVAALALPSVALLLLVAIAFTVGLAALVRWYQRSTGLWISGFRRGRTRPIVLADAAFTVTAIAGGLVLHHRAGAAWAPVVAGLLVAAFTTWTGHRFDAALARDLREQG